MKTTEIRSFVTGSNLQVRAAKNGSKRISGYAIRLNQPSADLGGFTEYVSASALNNLASDILLLRDHKQELLLARTTAGNLKLTVDNKGLFFEANLLDTNTANDAYTDISNNLLTGCSWGFVVSDDSWAMKDGQMVRTILAMEIHEISVTSFPAYNSTSVDARAIRSKLAKRDADDCDCDDPDDKDNPDCHCDDDDEEDRDCDCTCAECQADNCAECSADDSCDNYNALHDDDSERCLRWVLAKRRSL